MYTLKGTIMKQSEYKSTWPCHLGQKFKSLGQIIENHIVYYTLGPKFFTPKLITLRSRVQSSEILHQSYMLKFFKG